MYVKICIYLYLYSYIYDELWHLRQALAAVVCMPRATFTSLFTPKVALRDPEAGAAGPSLNPQTLSPKPKALNHAPQIYKS